MKTLPFFILFVSLSAGLSFLYALFFWFYFHYRPLEMSRTFTGFVVPALLTLLVVILVLRPAMEGNPVFQFRLKNLQEFILFIAGICIFIPLYFSTEYMKFFLPRIQEVTTPDGIREFQPGTFYRIQIFYADKKNAGNYFSSNIAGKQGEYARLGMYFVCPMLSTPADSVSGKRTAVWTGSYSSMTQNRYARSSAVISGEDFLEKSKLAFMDKDFSLQKTFYIPESSGFRDNLDSAMRHSPVFDATADNILLYPLDDSIQRQQKIRLLWTLFTLLGGIAVWGILVFSLAYFRGGNSFDHA